jgi:phytoene dehydrogenase-like protein
MAVVEKNRSPGGGYYAADRDADTGFRLDTDASQARRYFHMPHLGALAWAALARRRFNPFTFGPSLPAG